MYQGTVIHAVSSLLPLGGDQGPDPLQAQCSDSIASKAVDKAALGGHNSNQLVKSDNSMNLSLRLGLSDSEDGFLTADPFNSRAVEHDDTARSHAAAAIAAAAAAAVAIVNGSESARESSVVSRAEKQTEIGAEEHDEDEKTYWHPYKAPKGMASLDLDIICFSKESTRI